MKICVKDLQGSGSGHDPLTVSYAVIGGLFIHLFIYLFVNSSINSFFFIKVNDFYLKALISDIEKKSSNHFSLLQI